MSPLERSDIRKIWIAIITFMAITIVSQVFDLPGRVNGMKGDIKELEFKKMNKEDANHFFNTLSSKLTEQCALWNQYMISNESDKERIMEDIKTIQEDIKILIGKNRTVTRGSETKSQTQ
jgi:hypothetical protein